MDRKKIFLTEELDFAYLLELMPPLHDVPEFSWLPELFSIIGHERLITLCKYAGGETIRIPTLDELSNSITALQWFYDVHISKKANVSDIPKECYSMYCKIVEVYFAEIHNE